MIKNNKACQICIKISGEKEPVCEKATSHSMGAAGSICLSKDRTIILLLWKLLEERKDG